MDFFFIFDINNSNNRYIKKILSLLRLNKNIFSTSYNFFSRNNLGLIILDFFFIFNSSNTNFFNKNNLSLINQKLFPVFYSSNANNNFDKKNLNLIKPNKNNISLSYFSSKNIVLKKITYLRLIIIVIIVLIKRP